MKKRTYLTVVMLCLLTPLYLSAQLTHSVCPSGCDFTTIQAAVDAALPEDNITILATVHTEANITINKSLNICGGNPQTIVQARAMTGIGNSRIFNIGSDAIVIISNLVLQNGNLTGSGLGGAIYNEGNLALIDCTLTNNNAHRGGAIASSGQLGLINCTLNGNSVADQGMNRASGGAIYFGGVCALANCTVSGNSNNTGGAGNGGGITALSGGTLVLTHVTITNNSIGGSGLGAGVSAVAGSILSFTNTIIAGNSGAANLNSNGTFVTNTTNVITSCAGLNCPAFITGDPNLLPLADNGGCQLTHDIGVGPSSALNTGTPVALVTTDQRGAGRSLTEPDIGAVELSASVPACLPSTLCEAILPVELLHLAARPQGTDIVLAWATAQEINNEGFDIERSGDGIRWEVIGFVAGQGDYSAPFHYQYLDNAPGNGINYYRLNQRDLDGKTTYSPIVSAQLETAASRLKVFPNPTTTEVRIQLPATSGTYQLRLSNSLGQLLWGQTAEGGSQLYLPLSSADFNPGIYFLQMSKPDGGGQNAQTIRLLIQH